MPTNTAAWSEAKGAKLVVKPAPYTSPRANEIVVRNHAVAINPRDWIIQVAGHAAYRWLTYPFILGADLAGEVVEVGSAVTLSPPEYPGRSCRAALLDRVLLERVWKGQRSRWKRFS